MVGSAGGDSRCAHGGDVVFVAAGGFRRLATDQTPDVVGVLGGGRESTSAALGGGLVGNVSDALVVLEVGVVPLPILLVEDGVELSALAKLAVGHRLASSQMLEATGRDVPVSLVVVAGPAAVPSHDPDGRYDLFLGNGLVLVGPVRLDDLVFGPIVERRHEVDLGPGVETNAPSWAPSGSCVLVVCCC